MIAPVGVILAGGKGTRMGGVAKADIVLGGERLLTRVADRLAPQVARLAVNSNDPIETDLPVIADTVAGHLGPLAGILAGMKWAKDVGASHMVTVAVDTPFFPCDLVPYLLMAAEAHPDGLAVATTTDGIQGTFGVWPVSLLSELDGFLTSGQRKVRTFTEQQNAAQAHFPDTTPPSFFNINTPDDLVLANGWVRAE